MRVPANTIDQSLCLDGYSNDSICNIALIFDAEIKEQ